VDHSVDHSRSRHLIRHTFHRTAVWFSLWTKLRAFQRTQITHGLRGSFHGSPTAHGPAVDSGTLNKVHNRTQLLWDPPVGSRGSFHGSLTDPPINARLPRIPSYSSLVLAVDQRAFHRTLITHGLPRILPWTRNGRAPTHEGNRPLR